MGKIDDRNYRLRLAFADLDLLRPTHDQMMLALERRLRSPREARAMLGLPDGFSARYDVCAASLDNASLAAWPNESPQGRVREVFRQHHGTATLPAVTEWPDAPEPEWKIIEGPEWEPMLHERQRERRQLVGFCDLSVTYEVGHTLNRHMVQPFRAIRETDKENGLPLPRCRFEAVGPETLHWSQATRKLRLFFEVKSEIRSLGELLRQLQLYRSALPAMRENTPDGDQTLLIVFAPPHAEAARVCREQGYRFIEHHL